MRYEIRAKVDTWLKARNVQSSALAENEKSFYDATTCLPIAAYKFEGNHLLVTLGVTSDGQQMFINGRTNWYVYRPAVELLRDGQPISLPNQEAAATSGRNVPQCGVELIKEFEGYESKAYADPIHGWEVPTIGYGTTVYPNGQKVRQGDTTNPTQAEEYLIHHIESTARPDLERIPTWGRMNDNQRGAIYSFAYNLGSGFYNSPGFKSITQVCDSVDRWGDRAWITEQFVKYRNPGTSAEAGLRRRREAEAKLFTS